MGATAADRELAGQATALLKERGRPDLSVSASQVRNWRQVADALPLLSDRGPGRARMTVYAPGAANTAALIRIYLDEKNRDLDKAVLGALAEGAAVPAEGVRSALLHCLQESKAELNELWGERDRPRSGLPRRLRTSLPGSARGALASLTSDAILAQLLGKQPLAGRYAPMILIEAMFPDLYAERDLVIEPDFLSVLGGYYAKADLATLIRTARTVDMEDLCEACAQLQVLWSSLAGELVLILTAAMATGQGGEYLDSLFSAPEDAWHMLGIGVGLSMGNSAMRDPSRVALIGLQLLVLAKGKKRQWRELIERHRTRGLVFAVLLELMLSRRPGRLSEVLGPSQMSDEDRAEADAGSMRWLQAHADDVRAVFDWPDLDLDGGVPEA